MSSKSPRTQLLKMQASKGELPPIQLKRKNNEEENEIIGLIKKNLLFDKSKMKTQLQQSLSEKKDIMVGPIKPKNPYEDLPGTNAENKEKKEAQNPLRRSQ